MFALGRNIPTLNEVNILMNLVSEEKILDLKNYYFILI